MIYYTKLQPPMYRHYNFLDLLMAEDELAQPLITNNETNTKTYTMVRPNSKMMTAYDGVRLYDSLKNFDKQYGALHNIDLHELYRSFSIPKRKGGYRKINAPNPELMEALKVLKNIFEKDFGVLYHTTSFAYAKGRSTVHLVRRHQQNGSRWFLHLDIHDFFGSVTKEFLIQQLEMIWPFAWAMRHKPTREYLLKALDLAFLDGGLPQGTPVSPLLTNLIMVPIDHELANKLRDFDKHCFVYTRYADDFIISCKYDFNPKNVISLVEEVFQAFHTPFRLNREKTRYNSSTGSSKNWILGVCLNHDNQITIGHKAKKTFQSSLYNYVNAKRADVPWSFEDVQVLNGYYSYYRQIEPETIKRIIEHINAKMNADVLKMIHEDLST